MPRVRKNRPNFAAKGLIVISNDMTVNHFIPVVRWGEDLYSFVATRDCVIQKMFIYVSKLTGIEAFGLERYVYHEETVTSITYEIKEGMNPFEDGKTALGEGDVVRFSIPGVTELHEGIGSIAIGILLSNKVNI